jgi:hypothetical protein
MNDVQMICQLIGCSQEEASQALLKHETVVDAIESLLPPAPVVSGSKYIPSKPIVDSGLSDEQKELCERGRWLQDKVNAVFSVAHSKTLPLPDAPQEVLEDDLVPQAVLVESSEPAQNEPLPDCVEQTVPQVPKFETLPQRDSSLQYVSSNVLLAQNRQFHCPTNESQ